MVLLVVILIFLLIFLYFKVPEKPQPSNTTTIPITVNDQSPPQVVVIQKEVGTSNGARTITTVILLIFIPPIGFLVMWLWSRWSVWLKILISIPAIIGILFIIGMFATLNSLQPKSSGFNTSPYTNTNNSQNPSNVGSTFFPGYNHSEYDVMTQPYNVRAFSSLDGKSASIYWVTNRSVQSVVLYGTSPASLPLSSPETSPNINNHSVVLTSLRPGQNYYYRIEVGSTVFDNGGVPWSFETSGK